MNHCLIVCSSKEMNKEAKEKEKNKMKKSTRICPQGMCFRFVTWHERINVLYSSIRSDRKKEEKKNEIEWTDRAWAFVTLNSLFKWIVPFNLCTDLVSISNLYFCSLIAQELLLLYICAAVLFRAVSPRWKYQKIEVESKEGKKRHSKH